MTTDAAASTKGGDVEKLVRAHQDLDDPMTGAIWILKDKPQVCLVEILPELPNDDSVSRPVVFTPSRDFRYELHLIAGNLKSLRKAVERDADFAMAIVAGEVLLPSRDVLKLRTAARAALKR